VVSEAGRIHRSAPNRFLHMCLGAGCKSGLELIDPKLKNLKTQSLTNLKNAQNS